MHSEWRESGTEQHTLLMGKVIFRFTFWKEAVLCCDDAYQFHHIWREQERFSSTSKHSVFARRCTTITLINRLNNWSTTDPYTLTTRPMSYFGACRECETNCALSLGKFFSRFLLLREVNFEHRAKWHITKLAWNPQLRRSTQVEDKTGSSIKVANDPSNGVRERANGFHQD